mmetsp:Transcript_134312/g.218613  ORF Transcript_134312/g.218613 Transcript_134312/m.218613 type:complete len:213 (-) Transcript_134312:852-1490(-)
MAIELAISVIHDSACLAIAFFERMPSRKVVAQLMCECLPRCWRLPLSRCHVVSTSEIAQHSNVAPAHEPVVPATIGPSIPGRSIALFQFATLKRSCRFVEHVSHITWAPNHGPTWPSLLGNFDCPQGKLKVHLLLIDERTFCKHVLPFRLCFFHGWPGVFLATGKDIGWNDICNGHAVHGAITGITPRGPFHTSPGTLDSNSSVWIRTRWIS